MIPPQPSIGMTTAGKIALAVSVGVGLALRIALPIWWPERFAPEGRHDPRHQAVMYPFLLIPFLFAGIALFLRSRGVPVFRLTPPDCGDDAPAKRR